ncbi:MAG: rhodanese-related sulfurtransferase, partial [Alphaproteobacteria bacterium]|nr:rhodanese-related sulfurtransferase [Alphaproteobacteria bacterium]
AAVSVAQARAAEIAKRAGLTFIDRNLLDEWCNDASRTTYVFDVRTSAEFSEAHLSGSRNAPEGSIVMSPDHYFATLKARIVLADDDGVRATITALWLAQMGWGDIAVLKDGLDGAVAEPAAPPSEPVAAVMAPEIAADALAQRLADDAVRVMDVGESEAYETAHLPGASWCSRVTLLDWLRDNPDPRETVLTSEDGVRAHLAAGDLQRAGLTPPSVLAGGNEGWRAAGHSLVEDAPTFLCPRDDFWLASSERPGDVRQNVIAYLDWEDGLLAEIERGGRVPYRNLIWR